MPHYKCRMLPASPCSHLRMRRLRPAEGLRVRSSIKGSTFDRKVPKVRWPRTNVGLFFSSGTVANFIASHVTVSHKRTTQCMITHACSRRRAPGFPPGGGEGGEGSSQRPPFLLVQCMELALQPLLINYVTIDEAFPPPPTPCARLCAQPEQCAWPFQTILLALHSSSDLTDAETSRHMIPPCA